MRQTAPLKVCEKCGWHVHTFSPGQCRPDLGKFADEVMAAIPIPSTKLGYGFGKVTFELGEDASITFDVRRKTFGFNDVHLLRDLDTAGVKRLVEAIHRAIQPETKQMGKPPLLAPPLPRKPIVEKMCVSCPFGPNAGRPKLNVSDEDLAAFKATALRGEFYCHETVLMDSRTKTGADREPEPRMQPHFRVCRGGWELKLKNLRTKGGR